MQRLFLLAACAALFVAGCNGDKTENKDTKKKTDDTSEVEKKMDEKKMDEKDGSANKQSSLQAESCTSDSVTI